MDPMMSNESAEMVPDEFLSWLMSDLESKEQQYGYSPAFTHQNPLPQRQEYTQQLPHSQPRHEYAQMRQEFLDQQMSQGYYGGYDGSAPRNSSSNGRYPQPAHNPPRSHLHPHPHLQPPPQPHLPQYAQGAQYPQHLQYSHLPNHQNVFNQSQDVTANAANVTSGPESEHSYQQNVKQDVHFDQQKSVEVSHDSKKRSNSEAQQENSKQEKVGEKRKAPRSREIAKECRRRQRERKEELENRVAALKKENQELREHFQNVSQRTTDIQRQRASMESAMHSRLKEIEKLDENNEEKKNLVNLVKKFTDLYADYGSCRQKEVAFHLSQLEKLMMPTQPTKMILWTLQQDYKFFEEKSSPIFGQLVKELELTPDQVSFLTKQRSEALKLLLHLKETLNLIKQLKASIKEKHESFDRECGKIFAEASAEQSVQFILWITNNADKLAKVIPDFERSVPHIPHAPNISLS